MSDNRRDQLIEFVEREFIGPDPIDWPGMTQSNGQEILASDPPRTRYIAGILYPAETTDDKADLKDDECELLGESDGEDVEVKPQKLGDGIVEFLEDAEELINRSNAYRQSAISITVSVKDGDAIRVAVSAGTYTKVPAMDPATGERLENKYKYPRTALAWENDNAPLILPTPTDGLKKFPIGTTGLQFDITYRYRTDDSCIYTFTYHGTQRARNQMQLVLNNKIRRSLLYPVFITEYFLRIRAEWKHCELIHGTQQQCGSLFINRFIHNKQRQILGREVALMITTPESKTKPSPAQRYFPVTGKFPLILALLYRPHLCTTPRAFQHNKRIATFSTI